MEVAMAKKSTDVFCCYARKDQSFLKKLMTHLMPLQRQGLITVWNDMDISPGAVWEEEVSKHLSTAQVVLLLVSPDFMTSEYCYDNEMQQALKRHENGDARVIPVLIRPVDWLHTPFGKLQALPSNAKPTTTWSDRDQAFLDIALGIRQTIEELHLRGNPSIPDHVQGITPNGSINSGTTPISIPQHSPLPLPTSIAYRSIVGFPPLTDSKTIQQRVKLVTEVYTKLTQPDVTAVVLTGIGGVGKSTLAALVYHYAEEQQWADKGPFTAQPLWFTVDKTVALADLVSNLFQTQEKPPPNISTLSSQNQAAVLFNALNTMDKPRLIVLDQFENLLDWETGYALPDRPGVAEWIDALNSRRCGSGCRVLLTSRPRPKGTHEYPLAYMQVHSIEGLEVAEGIDLLRNRGVQATEMELQIAVEYCKGHALALTLLIALIHDYGTNLTTLLKDPVLWLSDIAINLLNSIYRQLSEAQRELLFALSVHRIPVPLKAVQALITKPTQNQLLLALRPLLIQHLVQITSEGLYQLHSIVANYVEKHFAEDNEQFIYHTVQSVHAQAAEYYLRQAIIYCPPRDERRQISDVSHFIEAAWQYCQAEQWQEAYSLILQEGLFDDLKRWGGNAILLELYHLLSSSNWWQSKQSQEANIYHNLGQIYDNLGNKQHAYSCYKKALLISQEAEDRIKEGAILNNLGFVCIDLEKPEEALYHLMQALYIRREVNDHSGESETLNDLGLAYEALGQTWQALDHLEQALFIRKEIKDRAGEGETLNNLGFVYVGLGHHQKALDYFQQALHICKEVGNRSGEGNVLNNLGTSYQALSHLTEAFTSYQQALLIRKEVGDQDGEGVTLFNISTLYLEQGLYITSFAAVFLAMSIFKEIQSLKHDGAQRWIDNIRREIGEEYFEILFAWVRPRAQELMQRMLYNEL